jgi:hypothetical protein
MNSMSRAASLLAIVMAACLAGGQAQPQAAAPASPASASQPSDQLAALVKQQFGPTFSLPAKFPTPVITADFDSDGVEDIAIVASSSEPMPDSFAFKYQVMDPYNGYFGMSNPAMSLAFRVPDPQRNHFLLVIFGVKGEGWRAATPKAKFVIVNVPFDSISVGRLLVKKKKPPIFVIKALETELMESAVYWDGKKWKWEPGNMAE